jgi:hypothetical protein
MTVASMDIIKENTMRQDRRIHGSTTKHSKRFRLILWSGARGLGGLLAALAPITVRVQSGNQTKGRKEISMRNFGVCSLVLVAMFICGAGAAHAGRSSSMAATCSVGDPAIQGNLYTIASGSVRHQTVKTGLITLYCPISPTITTGGGPHGGWFMTFIDPDGAGTDYYIQSQIIRSNHSGSVTAVSGLLSSNSIGSTGSHYIEQALTHTYDFANYYYYVRVNLYRTNTTAFPIFYGVGVDSLP